MLQNLTSLKLETVVLQVTTKCPYSCPQCYMKRGDSDMAFDIAKKVIDDAVKLGAQAVQLTGGEPLVNPHIFDIIQYASERGLLTLLATSGYACFEETFKKLSKSGLTAMCVSINGISESVNAKSRMPFEEALNTVRIAKRYNIFCFLNVVVTDDNVDEIATLGIYAKQNNIVSVNLLRPVPSNDEKYKPSLSADTIAKLVKITTQNAEALELFNIEGCFREYWESLRGTEFCCRDIGKTTYFVNVDGSVSPCSKTTRYKYNSLSEMLDKYEDWRRGCL